MPASRHFGQIERRRLSPLWFQWRRHALFQNNARYNGGAIICVFGGELLADDKLYKAEYLGSGTFVISKPKRKKIKVRQSQLRNPRRGSRKS
jgi:hypothetical protein